MSDKHSNSEKGESEAIELRSTVNHTASYRPSSDEERRLDRRIDLKFDLCVTLLAGLGFLFAGIDKTNIGNAATTTFIKDAHLAPDDVGNAVSLFAATFVPLQPFSVAVGRYVGPKVATFLCFVGGGGADTRDVQYWICFLMLAWGAISMAHAAINNRASLIGLRLALGLFEAGFYPTSIYLVSCCYPRFNVATRIGAVSCLFVFGSAWSGLIAYGILKRHFANFHNWQVLFLVEGGITLLLALVSFAVLPTSVGKAWFLTAEERVHAVRRMEIDQQGHQAADKRGSLTWYDIKMVLTSPAKIAIMICNLVCVIPVSAFGVFLALILQGMGYAGVTANLMTVPPFAIGTVAVLASVIISDKIRDRSLICSGGTAVAMVGLIVMVTSKSNQLRYGFTCLCMSGAFLAGPLGLAWLVSNTPDPAQRSFAIGLNGWSNLASVIAGQIFKAKYRPAYKTPLTILLCLLTIPLLGYLSVRLWYMHVNKRRARIVDGWSEEQIAEELSDRSPRRGDQKFTFQYGL